MIKFDVDIKIEPNPILDLSSSLWVQNFGHNMFYFKVKNFGQNITTIDPTHYNKFYRQSDGEREHDH